MADSFASAPPRKRAAPADLMPLSEFVECLNSEDTADVARGLQALKDALLRMSVRSPEMPAHSLLVQYLQSSPKCHEIFALWKAVQPGDNLAGLVCDVLQLVLTKNRWLPDTNFHIAKTVARDKMKFLMQQIGTAQNPLNVIPVLRLFAQIAALGPFWARDLFNHLNFGMECWKNVAGKRVKKGETSLKRDLRTYFVRFVLALLKHGDLYLVQNIIFVKNLVPLVFEHIEGDSVELLDEIFPVLLEKIFANNLLSRKMRQQLLTFSTFDHLAHMLSSKQKGVAAATFKFLKEVCGVFSLADASVRALSLFMSNSKLLASKMKLLFSFVKSMNLAADNAANKRELALGIINDNRVLIPSFFSLFKMNEPSLSLLWLEQSAFALRVLSMFRVDKAALSDPKKTIDEVLLPDQLADVLVPFKRSYLAKGLLSPSDLVVFRCCDLFYAQLLVLQSFFDSYPANDSYAARVRGFAKARLPSLQSLLVIHSKLKEDNPQKSAAMMNQVLRILALQVKIFPESIGEEKINLQTMFFDPKNKFTIQKFIATDTPWSLQMKSSLLSLIKFLDSDNEHFFRLTCSLCGGTSKVAGSARRYLFNKMCPNGTNDSFMAFSFLMRYVSEETVDFVQEVLKVFPDIPAVVSVLAKNYDDGSEALKKYVEQVFPLVYLFLKAGVEDAPESFGFLCGAEGDFSELVSKHPVMKDSFFVKLANWLVDRSETDATKIRNKLALLKPDVLDQHITATMLYAKSIVECEEIDLEALKTVVSFANTLASKAKEVHHGKKCTFCMSLFSNGNLKAIVSLENPKVSSAIAPLFTKVSKIECPTCAEQLSLLMNTFSKTLVEPKESPKFFAKETAAIRHLLQHFLRFCDEENVRALFSTLFDFKGKYASNPMIHTFIGLLLSECRKRDILFDMFKPEHLEKLLALCNMSGNTNIHEALIATVSEHFSAESTKHFSFDVCECPSWTEFVKQCFSYTEGKLLHYVPLVSALLSNSESLSRIYIECLSARTEELAPLHVTFCVSCKDKAAVVQSVPKDILRKLFNIATSKFPPRSAEFVEMFNEDIGAAFDSLQELVDDNKDRLLVMEALCDGNSDSFVLYLLRCALLATEDISEFLVGLIAKHYKVIPNSENELLMGIVNAACRNPTKNRFELVKLVVSGILSAEYPLSDIVRAVSEGISNFDEKADFWEPLGDMLYTIFMFDSSLCELAEENILVALAKTYSASMSDKDLSILKVLRKLDQEKGYLAKVGYAWGPAAVSMASSDDTQETGFLLAKGSQLFDVARVTHTYDNYPDQRAFLEKEPSEDTEMEEEDGEKLTINIKNARIQDDQKDLYDPSYVLPVLLRLVSKLDGGAKGIVDIGALHLVIRSLSSVDETLRRISYELLSRFTKILSTEEGREKPQIRMVLQILRNSVTTSGMILPPIITSFVAHSLSVVTKPEHPLFKIINQFFLSAPSLDLESIPLLKETFEETDLALITTRRVWLLEVIHASISASYNDYHFWAKHHLLDTLFEEFQNPTTDKTSKQLIIQIIERVIRRWEWTGKLFQCPYLLSFLTSTEILVQNKDVVCSVVLKLSEQSPETVNAISRDLSLAAASLLRVSEIDAGLKVLHNVAQSQTPSFISPKIYELLIKVFRLSVKNNDVSTARLAMDTIALFVAPEQQSPDALFATEYRLSLPILSTDEAVYERCAEWIAKHTN